MRFLVVDDEVNNRILLTDLLEGHGYTVKTAENGHEALDILNTFQPNLIVSDIMMPEMDGFELCRTLKKHETLKTIPFVFYSATYTDDPDIRLAMDMGAARFIIKPMEANAFMEEIWQVIKEHQENNLPAGRTKDASEQELEQSHLHAVGRKLDKKVLELQETIRQLEKSEEKYRRLVESLDRDYFIYSQNNDGFFTYVSPSIETVLGYAQDEFKVHYTTFLPDTPIRQRVIDHSEASIRGERQPSFEIDAKHKDGSTRYLEILEKPILNDAGKVIAVEGIAHDITERKRMEEQQNKQQAFVEASQDWIWSIDIEGTHTYSNSAVKSILGYEPEDIVGKNSLDLIHEEDRNSIQQFLPDWIKEKIGWNKMLIRWKHKNGGYRNLESTSVPAFNAQGELVGFSGVDRDITDRLRMEEQLEHERQYYRELFDATKDAIIVHDLSGAIHDVNTSISDLYGYTRQDMLSLSVEQLSSGEAPYTKNEAENWISKAVNEGPQQFEWRAKRKDGELFWVEVSLKSTSVDGEARIVAVIRDISERKQAEEALRDGERKLHAIFDHHFQLTGLLDREGRVIAINKTALDLANIEDAQVIGNHFWETPWWEPSQRILVQDAIQRTRNGEFVRFETTHPTPDGEKRHIDFSLSPVHDDEGNVVYLVPEGRDITEIKKADEEKTILQQQLNHSQKMEAVGQLASGVAHDFNNLLMVIFANTEIVMERLRTDVASQGCLEMIMESAEQAAGVTKSLLTFSRKVPAEKKTIDLCKTVEKTTRMLGRMLPSSVNVSVNLQCEKPVWINADATQIQQIIMNLTVNARDAMPEGGELTISVCPPNAGDEDQRTRLVVSDTGVGMPGDLIQRIFEPFFTTKPRGQGTGLGLAIIHGIVNDHTAQIEVDSTPGEGTTFTVLFPGINPKTETKSKLTTKTPHGQKETILLVDDNQFLRDTMASYLRTLGYEILLAKDGTTLLETWRNNNKAIRLFVFDIDLPDQKGTKCLTKIRAEKNITPAILITGTMDPSIEPQLDSNTFLLRKPFQMSELGRIAHLLLSGETDKHDAGSTIIK